VREGQRLGDVGGDRERAVDLEAAVRGGRERLGHRAAGEELRDEERRSGVLTDVVDPDDVRMVAEAAHEAHLALRALRRRGPMEERERDLALEHRVEREVDLLVRAGAERPHDPVAPTRDDTLGRRLAGRPDRDVVVARHLPTYGPTLPPGPRRKAT
jgi:hypothetical protein